MSRKLYAQQNRKYADKVSVRYKQLRNIYNALNIEERRNLVETTEFIESQWVPFQEQTQVTKDPKSYESKIEYFFSNFLLSQPIFSKIL